MLPGVLVLVKGSSWWSSSCNATFQTGMCIARSRTMDASMPCPAILLPFPFKRMKNQGLRNCYACFCCLTAAVSTIGHRESPKLSSQVKSDLELQQLQGRCYENTLWVPREKAKGDIPKLNTLLIIIHKEKGREGREERQTQSRKNI